MIERDEVLGVVRKLLNFPAPTICRHLVALELLDLLEQHGWCDPVLIKAVVDADDEAALARVPPTAVRP